MPYTPGPYSAGHLYLQWGGKLPGNESWSCGMRFYSAPGPGTPATSAIEASAIGNLAGVASAVEAYHTSSSSQISGAAKLSFVKLNSIGLDGHYTSSATNEHVVADVAGGGASPAPHPNQVALAISLVTGFSRGPAHRGRFYMPLPVFPVDADGLISVANRNFAQSAASGLLSALNAVDSSWQVGVFSRKLGAPGRRAVTGIEVGRVLDTQRRRRRSLAEAY